MHISVSSQGSIILKTVFLICRAGLGIIVNGLIYQLMPLNRYPDVHTYYTILPSLLERLGPTHALTFEIIYVFNV